MTPTTFWPNRRVFVTGSAGRHGAVVVRELLRAGARVVGLVGDRANDSEIVQTRLVRRMEVVRGRVEDLPRLQRMIAEYEPQTVFHLPDAGDLIRPESPAAAFESAVRGTWNLLEAAARSPNRPAVVIGLGPANVFTAPATVAAVADACAEMIATAYERAAGVRLAVARGDALTTLAAECLRLAEGLALEAAPTLRAYPRAA
jgi:CDP-glucose 4,6-dehydratase